MKLLLIRSATLLPAVLLILTSSPSLPLSGILITHAQDESRQIGQLDRVLGSGSDEEKRLAIGQLDGIKTEKASELLLRALKNNLANKRGNDVRYGAYSDQTVTIWTSDPSQNEMLVRALGNRKYKKALPTLRKMLKIKEKWLGFSKQLVAANIYLISPQTVKYTEDGELKIYPEPKEVMGIISLKLPSGGEEMWEAKSLNRRIRELVSVLGSPGGPVGYSEPFYKSLKEEIGLPTLLRLIKSDDQLIRPYAVEALGILGEKLNEIIPVLAVTVRDKDPRVRFRSTIALGHLLVSNTNPEEVKMIIPVLKTSLSDAEAEVRLAAIEPLGMYATYHYGTVYGRMEELMKDVMPLLVSAIDDKTGYVRISAAVALGRIGLLPEKVIPALVSLLKSPESSDRAGAVAALGHLTRASIFKQSQERERMNKEIGRALLTAADDPARGVRYGVAEALREVSPDVRGVIPALIQLTRDPAQGVRSAAAHSLGKFKVELPRIARALARMLKAPDEAAEVIKYALGSLGEIGHGARSAAPEVRRLLKNGDPRIREHAGYTLEKIERLPAKEGSDQR